MGKRANPMAVKAVLTYDIKEAAAALGKTPATIRSWIKDGLPVMSSRKPYLISGEAIRFYLRAKYKAAKRPLRPSDFFCPGCGGARQPVGMTATVWPMKNRTVLLKGVCTKCGGTCTRMISKSRLGEFAHRFQLSNKADSEP
ncbi:helix-turn-helix domain-containing protein [Rhodobacteraceae bacterium B1Z28]|uniref:Helix-turn-helix domain-containing protein n=1 Tax=Ruegeria haliotis TaxID=2747601 RepID=A0ABX2PSQ0_9RHOB|nr:helix-turn-helix domain-containing protein [Ruegeria haliotis]NVO57203.1 helix-turn-helix domain-containing protein [Ruegeria haliotis]